MKKLVLAATVAAVAVAVPAQAHKPGDDRGGERAEQSQGRGHAEAQPPAQDQTPPPTRGKSEDRGRGEGRDKAPARSRRCKPRRVRYVAAGLYVSSELTQTQGADTPDKRRDDRWSGTLTVDVKRANSAAKSDKGTTKVYTLTDAVVRFADSNGDGTRDQPVAGDRTIVQGRTTKLRRQCDQTGFVPELKIGKVLFFPPPPPPSTTEPEPETPTTPATP